MWKKSGKSYGDQMREIADLYYAEGNHRPATSRDIGAWAIQRGLWKPSPSKILDVVAEELSRAMREDYATDPQGRRVRRKHAARIDQITFWDDSSTATREHMEISFQQRRQGVVGDLWQLKNDVDSYNDNFVKTALPLQVQIEIEYDFRDDMADMEAGRNLKAS